MGLLSKPIKNLDDLFVHTLQDVYYAEQKITKALPKMIAKVSDTQLQEAFRSHLAAGHDRLYLADTAHIEANAAAIVATMPA